MRRFCLFGFVLSLGGLLLGTVRAATFQLNDGSTVSGEIVPGSPNGEGLNLRVEEGKYQRVPWTSFTQSSLQELAKDPKLAPFAEPYLEIPETEKIKKTEIVIREVPRLARPAKGPVLGAFLSSPAGLVALLLLYAANIYAGFEIAIFRARPVALVCGAAALLPAIGPLAFLLIPTHVARGAVEEAGEEVIIEDEPAAESSADGPAAAPSPGGLSIAHAQAREKEEPVETQAFRRGQFTFNRRFFETKFPGFFGVIRREAGKDMVLRFKTARGEFVVERITRIAANDLHVETRRGSATQEVMVPFGEIQEVHLQHKEE